MKRSFALLLVLLAAGSLFSQVPDKMTYQAVVRTSGGVLVKNGNVSFRISVLSGSPTGISVFAETHAVVTNNDGLATLQIGGGSLVSGSFPLIDWSGGPFFLKTEADPSGGTSYTVTAVTQLLSVPYALYAKNVSGHYIGELYGGGIIVALWRSGGEEHGLIASIEEPVAGAPWSNVTSTLIGSAAQKPENGQSNTAAILAQPGHSASAAKACDDYSHGGYNDWYLPSLWELNECFNAARIVNTVLGSTNGFQFSVYWCSTEYNDVSAWGLHMYAGSSTNFTKSMPYRVRPVRRF